MEAAGVESHGAVHATGGLVIAFASLELPLGKPRDWLVVILPCRAHSFPKSRAFLAKSIANQTAWTRYGESEARRVGVDVARCRGFVIENLAPSPYQPRGSGGVSGWPVSFSPVAVLWLALGVLALSPRAPYRYLSNIQVYYPREGH